MTDFIPIIFGCIIVIGVIYAFHIQVLMSVSELEIKLDIVRFENELISRSFKRCSFDNLRKTVKNDINEQPFIDDEIQAKQIFMD